MKIYIANKDIPIQNKKSHFILTRPFLKEDNWQFDAKVFEEHNLNPQVFQYELNINLTDIVLLPFPINYYFSTNNKHLLYEINIKCIEKKMQAYAFIGGDFGITYPTFSNIIYFRQGGFKSQLSKNNKGFIVVLSDHFQRLYQKETISPSPKNKFPIIGFCGHATHSYVKKSKEIAKCLIENAKRFFHNPFNKSYEPLFASAYERAKILSYFESSVLLKTNFIYRDNYRAGAVTELQLTATTLEYYNNILASDYVLCIRGAGNFSVRFYETLMMGKIPIFVNTDCLLPFENIINWKKHVVWVEWSERKNIAQIVTNFHANLSDDEFVYLQNNNRKLWKETLSIKGMLEMISNDI